MKEREIKHAIRLALGADPRIVLWNNPVGIAREDDRVMRFGLSVGSADTIGILAPSGRFLALEVKAANGRLRVEQIQFLDLVRRMGGFAAVVRTADEARAAIDRAVAGGDS